MHDMCAGCLSAQRCWPGGASLSLLNHGVHCCLQDLYRKRSCRIVGQEIWGVLLSPASSPRRGLSVGSSDSSRSQKWALEAVSTRLLEPGDSRNRSGRLDRLQSSAQGLALLWHHSPEAEGRNVCVSELFVGRAGSSVVQEPCVPVGGVSERALETPWGREEFSAKTAGQRKTPRALIWFITRSERGEEPCFHQYFILLMQRRNS